MIQIRPFDVNKDYPAYVNLLNQIESTTTTEEEQRMNDAKIPLPGTLTRDEQGLLTGYDRFKLVAANEQDVAIGYAMSWRAPWTEPGTLYHLLIVDQEHQRQGIGSALYERLEAWAIEQGASKVYDNCRDNEPAALHFGTKRGYEIERQQFESVLDCDSIDFRSIQAKLAKPHNPEISFHVLAEVEDSDRDMKLYELYRDTSPDIPGYSGDYPWFEEWKKWTLEMEGSDPEHIWIARDSVEFVGVVHLIAADDGETLYHEYTGVRRAYRGKGIASKLKCLAIEYACHSGAKQLRTHNDSLNAPMLNINRDLLGFQAVPGFYKLVKPLKTAVEE